LSFSERHQWSSPYCCHHRQLYKICYAHAFAIKSAEEAEMALFNHCCVYGVPSNIHTDNGSQYCNILISSLTNHFNIKHGLSIAYYNQESDIVERVNKEVNRHMRALVARPNQLDKHISMLPLV
jgi:hypothetical protein